MVFLYSLNGYDFYINYDGEIFLLCNKKYFTVKLFYIEGVFYNNLFKIQEQFSGLSLDDVLKFKFKYFRF